MTESRALAGGRRTPSPVLTNVDNLTMFGTGSIQSPLRAEGGGGGNPTTEHISTTLAGGALDPDVDVSFVSILASPEPPQAIEMTLAAGTTDGQRKLAVFQLRTNVTWQLTASGQTIEITADEGGAAELVWDSTAAAWKIVSIQNGTVL